MNISSVYDNIIIPIDESEISLDAVEEAIRISENNEIKIYGLYVDSRLAEDRYRDNVRFSERVSRLPELEEKASESDIDYEIDVIGDRKPHRGICRYASEVDADAIIMSTHSRKGLIKNVIFNSVTKDTIKKAPCPVIVIPHPD